MCGGFIEKLKWKQGLGFSVNEISKNSLSTVEKLQSSYSQWVKKDKNSGEVSYNGCF